MRIALGIEYDGSAFAGWQSQAHVGTVQDAVERALAAVAGCPIRTVCAGRTDAGVHALGQVVHFDTEAVRPGTAWVRGVNANLPSSVAVRWASPVSDDFHARFSARARSYRYFLLNRSLRPAIQHDRVGWFHAPLDIDAMRAGGEFLIGEHDFTAFRASECQAKSPVKFMRSVDIVATNGLITFEFTANAFLHHMVRNLVGALVYVGKGKHPPQWIAELLKGRDRRLAAPTFDAAGLYFLGPEYDPDWRLPGPDRMISASSIISVGT